MLLLKKNNHILNALSTKTAGLFKFREKNYVIQKLFQKNGTSKTWTENSGPGKMHPADHEEQSLRYKFRSWIVLCLWTQGKTIPILIKITQVPLPAKALIQFPCSALLSPPSNCDPSQAYIGIPQHQWENKSHKRSKFHPFPIKAGKLWLLEGDVDSGKSSCLKCFIFTGVDVSIYFIFSTDYLNCFPCTLTNSSFSIH